MTNPLLYRDAGSPADLRPFVRRFLVCDTPARFAATVPAPATGYLYFGFVGRGMAAGIADGKEMRVEKGYTHFSGQIDGGPVELAGEGPLLHVLAEFTATGFTALTGRPADPLTNRLDIMDPAAAPTDLPGLRHLALLPSDPTAEDALKGMIGTLRDFARRPAPLPEGVAEAAAAIEAAQGVVSVSGLAPGVPARTLARRFRTVVGLSPNRFSRTIRINSALGSIMAGESPAAVAAALSFADQSHLGRAIKSHFAQAPMALRQQMDAVVDAFPHRSRSVA